MSDQVTLTENEARLLAKYRQTIKMGHAHGEWDVKESALVKLWVTEKIDLEKKPGQLREGENGSV